MGEKVLDWLIDHVVPWIFLLFIGFALFGLGMSAICAYNDLSNPNFSLKKNDWSCTKIYEYQTTQTVIVGKVFIPQTITHKDCIQWSHK